MKFGTIWALIAANLKIWLYKLLKQTHRLLPYKVLISITNRCNSKCLYCDIWKIPRENPGVLEAEITLDDISAMFRDLHKNILSLAFTGGEVTLVKDFPEIMAAAREYCPRLKLVSFTTNALLPEKVLEYALSVKNLGLDVTVFISLDGDEELHDQIRNVPGSYRKCLAVFQSLKEHHIGCHFCLTVNDRNHEFVKAAVRQPGNPIRTFTFVHSNGIFRKDNRIDYRVIRETLSEVRRNYRPRSPEEWIERIYLGIAVKFIQRQQSTNIIPCEVMTSSVHIMATGEIRPCMYLPALGNIKTDKISDVYRSEPARRQRDQIRKDHCSHCWMSCYCQYSIMQHPFRSILAYCSGGPECKIHKNKNGALTGVKIDGETPKNLERAGG